MGVAQALFLRGDAHGIYLNINQKLINLILYVAADIVNFLEFTRNFFLGYSSSLTIQLVILGFVQGIDLHGIFSHRDPLLTLIS